MRNRDVRAAEYRRLATVAQGLADGSALAHVREKHEHAAATWTALAELDERPSVLAPVPVPPVPVLGPVQKIELAPVE